MDSELQNKIDSIIDKAMNDLKGRINREVSRSINKKLKNQARDIKTQSNLPKRGRKKIKEPIQPKKRINKKYYSDSEDCYSE